MVMENSFVNYQSAVSSERMKIKISKLNNNAKGMMGNMYFFGIIMTLKPFCGISVVKFM